MDDRTERPVVCSQRASQTRFSREYKNVILEEEERTGRPVVCYERAHQFVIEDDETESELSSGSRSFLHRVNDQVRKRQNQSSKDATEDSEEHSVIGNVYVFNIASICIHGEELLRQLVFHQKYRTSHDMKQIFDISEKLVSEQSDE